MKLTETKLREIIKKEAEVMEEQRLLNEVTGEPTGVILFAVIAGMLFWIFGFASYRMRFNKMGKAGKVYDRLASWLSNKFGYNRLGTIAQKLYNNIEFMKKYDKFVQKKFTPREANAFLKKWLSPADWNHIQDILWKDFQEFTDVPSWEKQEKLKQWREKEKGWFREVMQMISLKLYKKDVEHIKRWVEGGYRWGPGYGDK